MDGWIYIAIYFPCRNSKPFKQDPLFNLVTVTHWWWETTSVVTAALWQPDGDPAANPCQQLLWPPQSKVPVIEAVAAEIRLYCWGLHGWSLPAAEMGDERCVKNTKEVTLLWDKHNIIHAWNVHISTINTFEGQAHCIFAYKTIRMQL